MFYVIEQRIQYIYSYNHTHKECNGLPRKPNVGNQQQIKDLVHSLWTQNENYKSLSRASTLVTEIQQLQGDFSLHSDLETLVLQGQLY
jgi:hypothetical protein